MGNRLTFEKPLGMRDTLPFFYEQKQKSEQALTETMTTWGYQFLDTPMLEYLDTVGEASAIDETQLFKLLDQQGHTLVLRPDLTAPIARVAASQLKENGYPIRLAYSGPVFRAQQIEGGKPAQFDQVGIEYIGEDSVYADAEVISLQIEALKAAGLEEFQLTIGHIGFVKGLLNEIFENEEDGDVFLRYLYQKNYVGFQQAVNDSGIADRDKETLQGLLSLRGNRTRLEDAKELTNNESSKSTIDELIKLDELLEQYGVSEYVSYDLNLISHMNYYTGILFEGYAPRIGALLCNGGRYDQLLPAFQSEASATGFAVRLDRLVEALDKENGQKHGTIVLFDDEYFSEAVETAQQLRGKGEVATLQHIREVDDLEQFTNRYATVINVRRGGESE
ncbi:ATP phosphoribosyltransferase [Pontibacillus halophilus JSM 076056 = DSM 19796]|uniref:ATP phosphoribosyltransferase regulatory subunit n=1 Tax=Pontibacillus halophilus JSM 076056 = DSM 19796 TaxID=1385510 RepID=A0A0A5GLP1_9BACI|nr:ATP phosphoribosyltransferase regulatory subunit [Pontibacillus halophilus]KGX92914.1 ATP phosphoribosyltransferase [Pontibacillus halophilus JSM 076056 = DSM 19796]